MIHMRIVRNHVAFPIFNGPSFGPRHNKMPHFSSLLTTCSAQHFTPPVFSTNLFVDHNFGWWKWGLPWPKLKNSHKANGRRQKEPKAINELSPRVNIRVVKPSTNWPPRIWDLTGGRCSPHRILGGSDSCAVSLWNFSVIVLGTSPRWWLSCPDLLSVRKSLRPFLTWQKKFHTTPSSNGCPPRQH